MANSVLNILIKMAKQGGADVETVKALNSVKGALLDTAAVTGVLVAGGYAVKKGLDETVGTLVAYADEVRRVQNATGASAEDSSKLIQILDDQKISYEQLEKAIQKSGKAYDFSINGIANMSDEYLKLGNEQDKASFMQERFGKQWISFVPIMQQGGKAIHDASGAVEENLILTQKAVDDARRYEIAQDALNDSVQGLKVSIGTDLVGAVTDATNGFNIYFRALQIVQENHTKQIHGNSSMKDAIAQATKELSASQQALMQHKDALGKDAESEKANAAAVKETTDAHQSMLGLISSISNETENFASKQADVTAQMQENRAEAEKLYPWQKTQLDELNKKYADMATTYDQNAAAHAAAMGKIQFDLLVTKLAAGGVTDAEFAIEQQAGLMYGVFDQGSIESAKNMDLVTQAVNDGKLKVEDMKRALDLLPKYKSIDIVLKVIQQLTTAQQAVTASGSANYVQQLGNGYGYGYAAGGISTGPTSGHMELLHGTEAIVPLQNGSIPVQLQGAGNGGGTGGVNVYLTIASPMTIMDEQTTRNTLLPFILQGVREAKARGAI